MLEAESILGNQRLLPWASALQHCPFCTTQMSALSLQYHQEPFPAVFMMMLKSSGGRTSQSPPWPMLLLETLESRKSEAGQSQAQLSTRQTSP